MAPKNLLPGGAENLIPGVAQAKMAAEAANGVRRNAGKIAALGLAAVIGVGAGVTTAWGQHLNYVGIEATADLDKARTDSKAELVQFDDKQEILVATAYFKEKFTATQIPYKVNTKPIDVVPDYKVNKELTGFGALDFKVPFDALTPSLDAKTGKTNILVDGKKVIATAYWPGAGPDVVPFTVNKDGKGKNMGDRSGFRDSLVNGIGSNLKIVNLDTFKNTIDDLDAKVDHDIKLKALETFSETCAPKLEERNIKAINEAITRVVSINDRDQLGAISYTEGGLQWKTDLGMPNKSGGKTYESNANEYLIKDFKVDSMECIVPKEIVPNESVK